MAIDVARCYLPCMEVNQTFEARSIFHQLKTDFQFRLKSALWLSVSAVQGERLALSVLIWNLITQSPRLPFCQLPLGSPDATIQLQGIVNIKNVFYESFPYS
ncbi:hypothetical protein BDE02_03G149300 [Populus trichocarpa]|nr:hypothetical protein BDE02_03G149300 [Populus trichocarpa]